MPPRDELLLTCEHGGNLVPHPWIDLFRSADDVLPTHRGYDPGALDLARDLSARLRAPLFFAETTRLLIELNRSLHHRNLFSEFTRSLDAETRRRIIAEHWTPYRTEVESHIDDRIRRGGRVIHVAVHSFTPELAGVVRRAEVGILYDPRRAAEQNFSSVWRDALREIRPDWRVRRNYPYHGRSDGFTTHLRGVFPPGQYLGIELEVNQKFAAQNVMNPDVKDAVAESLGRAISRISGNSPRKN